MLLTVSQSLVSNICIPESVASTWHPCSNSKEETISEDNNNEVVNTDSDSEHRRRLLNVVVVRRGLAAVSADKCDKVCRLMN